MSSNSDLLTNHLNSRKRVGDVSLPFTQSKMLIDSSLTKQYIYSAPQTPPVWGGTSTVTINEVSCIVHKNIVAVTLGTLQSGVANGNIAPGTFLFTRITIESRGGVVLQTLTKRSQFIVKHTKYSDIERIQINASELPYNNATLRSNITTRPEGSVVYVLLEDLCLTSQDYFIGSPNHQLTFKIELNTLNNFNCPVNSATALPIMSLQLISEISRSTDNFAPRLTRMIRCPEVTLFSNSMTFTQNIAAGASSATVVLALTQNVTHLYFTVQNLLNAEVAENNFSNFLSIASFSLLNSKNECLINKSSNIDGRFYLFYLSKSMNNSSITQSDDSSRFIYGISLSSDLKYAIQTGSMCGSHAFTSLETLQVNLSAPAGQTLLISTHVFYEQMLKQEHSAPNSVSSTFYKR